MLRYYAIVRTVAREISEAANGAFEAYREGDKMDEPDITGLILGAIGERIRSRRFGGMTWKTHIFTSSGKDSEEKLHGADLMGVLDIDLPDYKVKKGFLAQAKKATPGSRFPKREWDRLTEQCKSMLARTPASFVFIYSRSYGIRIFPAVAALESGSRDIFDLYHHGVQRFFEDHIQCFIGDPRLDSPDTRILDTLAGLPVERSLHLTARMSE